jgi:putative NADH-flavin reductase
MKLFVIGATGRTGQEIIHQALEKGYQVTAFVRSPEKVTEKNTRLTILKGSSTDEVQLAEALRNHDAVITALGPTDPFKPNSLLHDSAIATTHAMSKAGVKRLVVLSAAAHFPGFFNRIARFVLRNHMRDSKEMEDVVQHSGLEWTIARPPRLTQKDDLTYRIREDAPPKLGFVVARKAVASFMLDLIEKRKHLRKVVGIAQ